MKFISISEKIFSLLPLERALITWSFSISDDSSWIRPAFHFPPLAHWWAVHHLQENMWLSIKWPKSSSFIFFFLFHLLLLFLSFPFSDTSPGPSWLSTLNICLKDISWKWFMSQHKNPQEEKFFSKAERVESFVLSASTKYEQRPSLSTLSTEW